MAILISWGDDKPEQCLVELMLTKAGEFHVIGKPTFGYGYKWPDGKGNGPSYDRKCWHIRDDLCTAAVNSLGLEGCQGMLEGIQAGWDLAKSAHRSKGAK